MSAAYLYILLRLPWLVPPLASPDVGCSARKKSKPRNGAGEIITAAAEIARETVSATNRIERAARKPREFATK